MSLGPWEIAGIVIIVLVVFGAGRLAGVGRALGTGVREFREEAGKPVDHNADDSEATTADESKS